MTDRRVRVDTNGTATVLWAFFRAGAPIEFLEYESDPNLLYAKWAAPAGDGTGMLWLRRDHPRFEEHAATAAECQTNPAMGVLAWAVLVAALEAHERGGLWHLERAAELLYGPRDQWRSHRERQLRPLHRLVALFSECAWDLDAPVRPRKTKRKDSDVSPYGGHVQGQLMRIRRTNQRTATVHCGELAEVWHDPKAPYVTMPAEYLLLDKPGHANPEGRDPSRAARVRFLIGLAMHNRYRASKRPSDGDLQAVNVEHLMDRWAGLDLERTKRRGHMQRHVDRHAGDVAVFDAVATLKVRPLEPQEIEVDRSSPGVCMFRFRAIVKPLPRPVPKPEQPRRPVTPAVPLRPAAHHRGLPLTTGPPG